MLPPPWRGVSLHRSTLSAATSATPATTSAHVAATAADYLRRSGQALVARRDPPPVGRVEAALDDYADAFAAVRREGLTLGLPVETVERIFALGFALDQLRQNFRDLERCVGEAARRQ